MTGNNSNANFARLSLPYQNQSVDKEKWKMKKIITKGIMGLDTYRKLRNSLHKLSEGDNKSRARARRIEHAVLKMYSCFESGHMMLPFFFA